VGLPTRGWINRYLRVATRHVRPRPATEEISLLSARAPVAGSPLPPGSAAPRLATQLGPLSGASPALASGVLDKGVEIVAPVMIRDLVAGLDVLDRADLDHVFDEIHLRIGSA